MSKFDVCALGELLIDFTENCISSQGKPIMDANPGGAPCNVLAMLTNLGYKTSFIGKIGNDIFGRQLKQAVSEAGIEVSGIAVDNSVNTTLAFVHTLPDGDREFSFYRNPGADMMLSENEVNEEYIKNSRIFHYGSLSMTNRICEAATKKSIAIAEKNEVLCSFDPNLRENLWRSIEEAKEKIKFGLEHCDILKISDNEIQWLTGEKNLNNAVQKLKQQYNIPLIFLSCGKNGSMAFSESSSAFSPVIPVKTIETTGAGDTFCGCILGEILRRGFKDFSNVELTEILHFANAAAAIITTKKGALRVMPKLGDINKLLSKETKQDSYI